METVSMPFLSVLVVGLGTLVFYLYWILWQRPRKIRRVLGKQGIEGPRPLFLLGNIWEMKRIKEEVRTRGGGGGGDSIAHDYSSRILPYFDRWRKIYGPTFMFSIGNVISVYVNDVDLVKEICLNKSLNLGKPSFLGENFHALLGKGVITSSGQAWAIQRKIVAAEFFIGKVKSMVSIMVESTLPLLKSWEARIEHNGGAVDIRLDKDFDRISADVISRACFGSNYSEGEEIFSKIDSLKEVLTIPGFFTTIPGSIYLPTKRNRMIRRLAAEIRSLIGKVVEERKEGAMEDKDFLQTIIENASETGDAEAFVIDNCKNIYFAGQETVSNAAKWVLVLLAYNQEWQMRVREEVMEICGVRRPNMEMLRKMTSLTMVIQETLRLYPAAPAVSRQVQQDMKLGDLYLPTGTVLLIPALKFHHDPELWGLDADRFNPERFVQGISGACKHPHIYMPFGIRPRTCLGQNFAMVELKTVLTMLLARFKVSPSPSYRHSVAHGMVLEAEHGVHVIVERV